MLNSSDSTSKDSDRNTKPVSGEWLEYIVGPVITCIQMQQARIFYIIFLSKKKSKLQYNL